ncbi:MAG: glycosyltransferase, partial [Actinomycetota bacterium]|nr:glycosyltransferase [Actinomycetota bacterium]
MTTYGMLSTYPPTQCGLATFSAALTRALRGPKDSQEQVEVIAVVDESGETITGGHEPAGRDEPSHEWVRGSRGGAATTAARLSRNDVAIVQHEYGIFGGADGDDVLEVARDLSVPLVVVLHTVLTTPTLHQREILDELVLLADVVVTMTRTARERLITHYTVDPSIVQVVPHGALDARPVVVPDPPSTTDTTDTPDTPDTPYGGSPRPTVLTWGLIGPGKGIEWALQAMTLLRDLDPRYLVVGETHPKVLEHEGERYRERLEREVASLELGALVEFDPRYLDAATLRSIVDSADVVLLPYDSLQQVTSGVLTEAVCAGRPVVATGFPHARELLASGAGIVVERQDPVAMAAALRRVLTE